MAGGENAPPASARNRCFGHYVNYRQSSTAGVNWL